MRRKSMDVAGGAWLDPSSGNVHVTLWAKGQSASDGIHFYVSKEGRTSAYPHLLRLLTEAGLVSDKAT